MAESAVFQARASSGVGQIGTSPLVSAVIPAFNSAATLARAIESALAQTYRPLEIIVVDDCSTDDTSQIAEAYAPSGVRLVRLERQRGASGARNAGIHAACGALVAFLDSDDEWAPSKIAKQVALIASGSDFVFVSCACRLLSEDNEDLGDLYGGRRPIVGADCWKGLLASNTIGTPSVVARRDDLLALGGFNPELKVGEDQDMWIRLALRGAVGYVDECLVTIYSRPNSLSSGNFENDLKYALPMIERHLVEQRARLNAAEYRAALGERLNRLGRRVCGRDYRKGSTLLWRSIGLGYRPLSNAVFLVYSAPPITWLKQRIRTALGAMTQARERIRVNPRKCHPMVSSNASDLVRFAVSDKPRLLVIVDAEEEFDWYKPFSRSTHTVRTMSAQKKAHAIYKRYALVPTYAIDYPIAMQEPGYRPLLEMLDAGECEIGAQLHTWVTPPFEEELCERNSYAGNLPEHLERRKLQALTETIERRFKIVPRLYRAGRYGAGENTLRILDDLGFDVDCSVVPDALRATPFAPDYRGATARPYWLSTRRPVLEIPVTASTIGTARVLGETFYRTIASNFGSKLRLPGLMARSHVINRVRLTPEGNPLEECKQLTRSLLAEGQRVFAISYHSPSLEPGNTPYVRDERDLEKFLGWIEGYLEFFFEEMNGIADTATGLHKWALAHSAKA